MLSTHIREQSIETVQKFLSEAPKAFTADCGITYVDAIYNYKKFYDTFVDPDIMVKKEEYTNLCFRFERLAEAEKADERNVHLDEVKVCVGRLVSNLIAFIVAAITHLSFTLPGCAGELQEDSAGHHRGPPRAEPVV